MIISLIGYMGSGKTLISNELAKNINYKIIDLDHRISEKENLSIPEIFQKKGEIYFRKQERRTLEEVFSLNENIVLSLGGGTPAYYDNIDLINQKSKSIYLRANINTLTNRLVKEKEQRPIIANLENEKLPEFIAKHLFERSHYYNQANLIIDTDGKTPESIVQEIILQLDL